MKDDHDVGSMAGRMAAIGVLRILAALADLAGAEPGGR